MPHPDKQAETANQDECSVCSYHKRFPFALHRLTFRRLQIKEKFSNHQSIQQEWSSSENISVSWKSIKLYERNKISAKAGFLGNQRECLEILFISNIQLPNFYIHLYILFNLSLNTWMVLRIAISQAKVGELGVVQAENILYCITLALGQMMIFWSAWNLGKLTNLWELLSGERWLVTSSCKRRQELDLSEIQYHRIISCTV